MKVFIRCLKQGVGASVPLVGGLALAMSALLPQVAAASGDLPTVEGAYVRLAPPGAKALGAFMIIRNPGTVDRTLVRADSPTVQQSQLHDHVMENGVMKMRQVPTIALPAGARVELKPGGYHVMLINPSTDFKEGDRVPMVLEFDDGSRLAIEAPVRRQEVVMPASKDMAKHAMDTKAPSKASH